MRWPRIPKGAQACLLHYHNKFIFHPTHDDDDDDEEDDDDDDDYGDDDDGDDGGSGQSQIEVNLIPSFPL